MKWNDFDTNKNAFPNTIRIIADWLWFISPRWKVIKDLDKNKFIEQNLQPLFEGSFREPTIKDGKINYPAPALGTFLRNLGFIDDDYNISPLVDLVANNKITLQEYSLVIFSKHRGWINGTPVVNCLVLLCLYLLRNNYCDVSKEMLKTLSSVDGYNLNQTDTVDNNRYDLLYNYIKGIGLFDEVNSRLVLKDEAKEIIDFIAENKDVITVDLRTNKNDRYKYYGDTESGIFKLSGLALPSSWSTFYPNLLSPNHDNRLLANSNKYLQKIYYGAPGTGKSNEIKDLTGEGKDGFKFSNNFTFRTTFHPDSDYSSFLGAYKPIWENDKIVYKFRPQTFLKAYVAAWAHPNENVALVIEEINRGNCAQIFGDIFQLLDRESDGLSKYPIESDIDMQKFLSSAFSGEIDEPWAGKIAEDDKDKINEYYSNHYDDAFSKIASGEILALPKNLSILATMNTSDQSLFPMDSAFKRRWEWQYMPIVEGEDKNGQKLGWEIKLSDNYKNINWWNFLERINKVIEDLTTSEDKKLGYFFCQPDLKGGLISAKRFVDKVIFYLWNDVFKDYAFDAKCCKNKDGKEVLFAEFYKDGNPINIDTLRQFFETLTDDKNPSLVVPIKSSVATGTEEDGTAGSEEGSSAEASLDTEDESEEAETSTPTTTEE